MNRPASIRPHRCDRLRNNADFQRVRTEGRSWSSPLLVVQAAPNQKDAVRIGIVASKRLGKAVRRNRVRRLVREAVRALCRRLQNGWDLVIVGRTRIVGASLAEIQAALEDVLNRAGLLDGPPVATISPTGGFPFVSGRSPEERTGQ